MILNKLPDVRSANITGKRIFLRMDLDVPLTKFKVQSSKLKVEIEDDTRLVAGLPTIEYLLSKKAYVIIGGHLGRPQEQIQNSEFSLVPIAEWLIIHFNFPFSDLQFQKIDGFSGWKISENLFLLENLRFYPGEEKNTEEFAKKLAKLADLYVNDAFAMTHRSHASVVGVAKLLPCYAGLRLQKEVLELTKVLGNPRRPLVVIVGGKKIETKLPLIEKMHQFADYVLVGGLIAKEKGELIRVQHEKIQGRKGELVIAELNNDGSDIRDESLEKFRKIIKMAATIVWNGPMGLLNSEFRIQNSELGTRELAEMIVKSGAYKIAGGGDTTEFLKKIGLFDKFDFVSTGGGAMLTFLSGESLPGLTALLKKT